MAGLRDLLGEQPLAGRLTDDLRLDGRTCLVTGASSGLGFAAAAQLAQRGARVLMVSRSGIPEAGDEVRSRSGSDAIEQLRVDLSDLEQVHGLADTLRDRGERIDVLLDNAGVATPKARKTPQGLDAMFVTNYLSKFLLAQRLLIDGTIVNDTLGPSRPDVVARRRPRIIYVSSDSHRGASAIDWESFGQFEDHGVNRGIENYSYFKLILNTYAVELSRRLGTGSSLDVPVHVMCPGPVNTNILRDAPPPLMVFMKAMFRVFFRDPEVAARPAVYMCASGEFERETRRYLHMFRPKAMDDKCYDPQAGSKLWERTVELLDRVDPRWHGSPS